MYYSFIHLPLPFNCQFHSQLEKSTIFLTLQIISHFSSPLVLSRKYQQHLPASIHNLIHIPSNYPITHVDRPDHFSSSGTTSLPPSILLLPPKSSKTTEILTGRQARGRGNGGYDRAGISGPPLSFVESNTFARHFVAIELWPQYIAA